MRMYKFRNRMENRNGFINLERFVNWRKNERK